MTDTIVVYSHVFGPLSAINGIMISFCFLFIFYSFFGDQFSSQTRENMFFLPFASGLFPARHASIQTIERIASYWQVSDAELTIALFGNITTVYSIGSLYCFGRLFHGYSGWRIDKPFNGGLGFVLAQTMSLLYLVLSIITPWLISDRFGFLKLAGLSKPKHSRLDSNFGCLCLVGCMYSFQSLLYQFIAILKFDRQAERRHEELTRMFSRISRNLKRQERKKKKLKSFIQYAAEQNSSIPVSLSKLLYARTKSGINSLRNLSLVLLTEIDEQKVRLNLVTGGNPENNFYVFLLFTLSQFLTVVYLNVILAVLDKSVTDEATRIITLCSVFLLMLGTIISTQTICGRLRNGRLFRHFMIWKGGWKFIVLQTIGWILVSIAMLEFIYKITQDGPTEAPPQWTEVPGLFGLAGQLFVILSVFTFDRTQALLSVLSEEDNDDLLCKKRKEEKKRLSNEIREAKVMQIFGSNYDYSDDIRFENDYVRQRTKILNNIEKFAPDEGRVSRAVTRNTNGARERTRSPTTNNNRENFGQHVWEEYEDEAGNVFYYNITTGVSYRDLPPSVTVDVSDE